MGKGLRKEDSAAIKGIAILLMICHHCYRTEKKFAGYQIIFSPFSQGQIVTLAGMMKICVGMFALVSGFGLMYSYRKSIKKAPVSAGGTAIWVKIHIFSTLSGFWFLAVLSYAVHGIRDFSDFSRWGDNLISVFAGILTDIVGFSGITGTKSLNGTWWYMGAAVVFVVCIPLLTALMDRLGGMACVVFVFMLPRVLGVGFPGGRSAVSFLMALVVGMLCCQYNVFEKFHLLRISERGNGFIKFLGLLLVIVFAVYGYVKLPITLFWEFHYALVPFLVCLFIVEYLSKLSHVYWILGILGAHSMTIWLVHTFVRDDLRKFVFSVPYFLAPPMIILVISMVISVLVNQMKKYSGYDSWIKKMQDKMV